MEFIKDILSEDVPKSKYVVFAYVDNGNLLSPYIEENNIIREFDENQMDELRQFIIYCDVLEYAHLMGTKNHNYKKFKFINTHFKDLGRDSKGRRYNIYSYEVMYFDEFSRRCDVDVKFSEEDLDEIKSYRN